MCGRTSNQTPIEVIEEQLQCNCSNPDLYKPKYNVAPSNFQPAVVSDTKLNKSIKIMQWGFIPSWTNKNSNNDKKTIKAINARDDSLLGNKQLFRRVKQNQRCAIVATGYYEWKKEDNKKVPYYVSFKDGKLLLLAAVYDILKKADGTELYTYAIVTTKCSKSLSFLHPRMPVILNNDEDLMNWINPRNAFKKVSDLMKSTELGDLQCYRVSLDVNKVENQSPNLIVEVKGEEKTEKKPTNNKSITDFFAKKDKNENKNIKKEEDNDTKEDIKVKEEDSKEKVNPVKKEESKEKQQKPNPKNNKNNKNNKKQTAGQKRKIANKANTANTAKKVKKAIKN
ncbi:DUF159-domain-containing protein [Neocallimastix lanati (nom. inval.)]|jgi:putative SOS response-associated peptidase YedK|nr:DUF159-domain-containing protein [Neocallimastix sp. JGI-2020a]